MDKELLFKEIRRQRVLLWVGAGFSIYAGYPSGKELAHKLYNELSTEQKKRLAESLEQESPEWPEKMPLPELAQYFVTLNNNNRDALIDVLNREFTKNATSTHVHEQLASLAYIDNIVTTNYDTLFEQVYGTANIQVVTDKDNVTQIDKKPVNLFKIHGELSRPRTLVITTSDYQNFFGKADELIWTHLKALMSKRTIVFLGYSVEDPNVLDAFVSIYDTLKELMKPAYVIGPSMTPIKQKQLEAKNIYFIQASGQEFINEFFEDTKKKALSELKDSSGAYLNPISQTLRNLGLQFDIRSDANGITIDKIKRANGPTKRELILPKNAFQLLSSGETYRPLKIEKHKSHQVIRMVEGFVLPSNENVEFWITRAPGWEKTVDIRFRSGLLVQGVDIRSFRRKNGITIVALTSHTRAEYVVERVEGSKHGFKVRNHASDRGKIHQNIYSFLEQLSIMKAFRDGTDFEVLIKGEIIWSTEKATNRKKTTHPNSDEISSDNLDLIREGLQLVEKFFNFSMHNFRVSGYDVSELIELSRILSRLEYKENSNKTLNFAMDDNVPLLEAIGIGKTKSTKEDITIETSLTKEFNIFDWVLRVIWSENITVVQAVCKRLNEEEFTFKSKSNLLVYKAEAINATEIVSVPTWQEPTPQTIEELLEEQQPRH